ncbi:MAG: hypothetical protein WC356_03455 [Candidatus Micrarchaeia archaeon]|jgi:predicted  nucleic acid-binding Zn-ribbon protein
MKKIEGLSREDAFKFFDDAIKGVCAPRSDCTGSTMMLWPINETEEEKIKAYITARDALNPKAIEKEKDMDNTERAKDEVREVAKVLREARNKFPNKRIFTIEISSQAADYLAESLEALGKGEANEE